MRLRMIAGPNGSGKTTILRLLKNLDVPLGDYINADDIEANLYKEEEIKLSGFNLDESVFSISQTLKSSKFISDIHKQIIVDDNRIRLRIGVKSNSYIAAGIADALRQSLINLGRNLTFETVMSHPSKIDLLKLAAKKGYRIYLYFVCTDNAAINVGRVYSRHLLGGHTVPQDLIESRYIRVLELLPSAIAASDRAYLFDNSIQGQDPAWVAEWDGQQLYPRSASNPAWLRV